MSEQIMDRDVERIVNEVLAQLGHIPAQPKGSCSKNNQGLGTSVPGKMPANAPIPSQTSSPCSEKSNPPDSNTLALDARVVTMKDVHGRLDGVRRVAVSRGAIVTPAVRDELLRRGIALDSADASASDASSAVRLALMVSGTDFDPTALSAALAREGFKVETSSSDCLIAAVDRLAAETAKPNTLSVLLTKHVAAGLCLANRLRGVRAIRCTDAMAVAKTSAAVGANLLAADPKSGGFFQLKQIITEFGRGGVNPCPTHFLERLG
jgi:hypothetical protein